MLRNYERIRATNQIAREYTQQKKIKTKQYYDRSARKMTFTVGDEVLLYDESVKKGRSALIKKSKWIGPNYREIKRCEFYYKNKSKNNLRTCESVKTVYRTLKVDKSSKQIAVKLTVN